MVCILLGTGFEEAEALVTVDILRRHGYRHSIHTLSSLGGTPPALA